MTKEISDKMKLLKEQYENVLAARYWKIRPLGKTDKQEDIQNKINKYWTDADI
jgi:hypothetical protein